MSGIGMEKDEVRQDKVRGVKSELARVDRRSPRPGLGPARP